MIKQDLQAILLYLKSQNVDIDSNEFKFQVESHPDYPTLLSFVDALDFFNIPNVATKVTFDELDSLPDEFIGLLGAEYAMPFLFFIKKEKDHFLYNDEKKLKKISKDELSELWRGMVLLAEKPNSEIEKKKTVKNTYISIIFLLFFIILYSFSKSLVLCIFSALSTVGLYLSFEALKTELGVESKLSQTFCSAIPNSDCSQVINSKKSGLFNYVKFSDISLWLFSSQLLGAFFFSILGNISSFTSYSLVVLIISVPVTIYSIYFQYSVEETWCPLCLAITAIIYIQISFLLTRNGFTISSDNLILFSFSFILMYVLIYLLKPIYIEQKLLKEDYIKSIRVSKNYVFFKNNLLTSPKYHFEKQLIILGNPDTAKKISLVTSPFCGFCEEAHEIVDNLLEKHPDEITINIRFNFSEKVDEKMKELFLRLTEIYLNEGQNSFTTAIKIWHSTKNLDGWLNKYGKCSDAKKITSLLNEISEENHLQGLNFTPAFILNEYRLPNIYDRNNLKYFVQDWIEDNI
ncbi:vitamin K epoxide reductase family protein [uncultured Chryseobacterium sp.]|uniref:vitamin K epoxide reductase family protein n=1 Tax=uncultured Chryseobacterium sp. TaxID=259322 RepID=UPI0025CDB2E7|nr:vitamin K epoxide reductase family protein [uncultured Chryseobacterium sp.]